MTPQANLRLARGRPELAPPRNSPNQSIKCSDTTGAHGSKENPRHACALALSENRIPALFRQPALCGHHSTVRELCGKAGVNSVTLCHLLSYDLHVAPLEGGRRNPRKRYGCLPRARAGRCRDIKPAGHVFSVTSAPVRPSPPLCRHPGHCSAIPGTVGLRDGETSPHPLLCDF
jgi:hypothetical protein